MMSIDRILQSNTEEDDEHWITVSDLMSALMVIFLFIAITYIRPVTIQRDTVKALVVAWKEGERKLYEALFEEFKDDLPKWNAELDPDLIIRFKAPDVLFATGESTLRRQFQDTLRKFLPRYVAILERFREKIEEVRIEGHTSSDWRGVSGDYAYAENMRLSQDRTRAVLQFTLQLPEVAQHREWLRSFITAVGRSSSKLKLTPEGREDPAQSRRVEFRVVTKSKEQIVRVLETLQ
jgi:outer membrane protein OmpA-like peptidoglycan-associated protein